MRQERKQTQLDDISAAATESVSADLRVLVPGGRQGGDQQFEGSDHAVAAGFDDQVYNLVANAVNDN